MRSADAPTSTSDSNFLADGTWDVPNNYSSAVVRNILGGWQFGGKWVGETGLPFTVTNGASFAPICSGGAALVNNQCPAGTTIVGNSGGDYNADGYNTKLPNVPSFGAHLSGQSKSQFLNGIFKASSFPAPALGVEGDLGRNRFVELIAHEEVKSVVINMEHAAFDQGLAQSLAEHLKAPCYALSELKAENLYHAVKNEMSRPMKK